jgi:ATP phosphoribosyltransferase regulatory subunit HisZ
MPGYDKGVEFAAYSAGYPQAARRAEQMDKKAREDGESGRNPTTGVYKLTEAIRQE